MGKTGSVRLDADQRLRLLELVTAVLLEGDHGIVDEVVSAYGNLESMITGSGPCTLSASYVEKAVLRLLLEKEDFRVEVADLLASIDNRKVEGEECES